MITVRWRSNGYFRILSNIISAFLALTILSACGVRVNVDEALDRVENQTIPRLGDEAEQVIGAAGDEAEQVIGAAGDEAEELLDQFTDETVTAIGDTAIDVAEETIEEAEGALARTIQTGRENLDLSIDNAFRNVEHAIELTAGETNDTLTHARNELDRLVRELDGLAGNRIADIDSRIQAKLDWLDAYTAQLNVYALEIIETASVEAQKVTRLMGQEARMTIGAFGYEVRGVINLAGSTASRVVREISTETQTIIRQVTENLDHLILESRRAIADIDRSIVTAINGTIYFIDMTTDRLLLTGGLLLGCVFLYLAFRGWGLGLLAKPLPNPGPLQLFVKGLIGGTFVAALLPFSLSVQNVRSNLMIMANQAKPFTMQAIAPRIWAISPLPLVISSDGLPEFGCVLPAIATCVHIEGANFNTHEAIEAAFANQPLQIAGKTDNQIFIDLTSVSNFLSDDRIIVKFGNAGDQHTFDLPIVQSSISDNDTEEAQPLQGDILKVIHYDFVRIRSGPGFYPELYRAQPGDTFEVIAYYPLAQPHWWYQVRFVTDEGQSRTGWMTGDPMLVDLQIVSAIPRNTAQNFRNFPS